MNQTGVLKITIKLIYWSSYPLQVIIIVYPIMLRDQNDNQTDIIFERLRSVQYLDLHFLLT